MNQDPPLRRRRRQLQDSAGQTHTGSCATEHVTCDVFVEIDGCEITALADTGADHSVMSQTLATELKKVLTPWAGLQIRTAGGHLITPVGRCTARITIHGFTYIGTFIVLPDCSKSVSWYGRLTRKRCRY